MDITFQRQNIQNNDIIVITIINDVVDIFIIDCILMLMNQATLLFINMIPFDFIICF